MKYRWIGAILIITGCGGWGVSLARAYRYQELLLLKLQSILQMMRWELSYRLTPLPELCRNTAKSTTGPLRRIFSLLSVKLQNHVQPDASGCMMEVLKQFDSLPPKVKRILRHLGRILGRYDLEGQLQGMDVIIEECRREHSILEKDREIRMRSYRTLGICAGVALVILFI